ncbi:hypothetical protein AMELA_G00175220 [Ameiurus melas]|uniref:Uncharacterized protein n=1 Tax=Ameiurus melas TaxID=219545 RepID=A0A7J6AD43_AMEME|nr:hypothetical protein AMELA_G00175220 [Ameiurus melas]
MSQHLYWLVLVLLILVLLGLCFVFRKKIHSVAVTIIMKNFTPKDEGEAEARTGHAYTIAESAVSACE